MRKILLMTVFFVPLSAGQALAQNSYRMTGETGNVSDFTGPYAGATLGYDIGSFDTDGTIGGVTASNDAGIDGFEGGLLGGYGFEFQPGFMSGLWSGFAAVELGYEWSAADGDVLGTGIDKDDSMMVSFRPGMSWNNTALGYGIIGYSRTKFEAAGDDDWINGLQLGAGTEMGMVGPLKTRLEYVYTGYEDKSFNLGGGDSIDFDGHDSAIKLGALMRF